MFLLSDVFYGYVSIVLSVLRSATILLTNRYRDAISDLMLPLFLAEACHSPHACFDG